MKVLDLAAYTLADPGDILTPALLVYPEMVDVNIAATLRLMHGDPNRWRPHLKTVKMPWAVRRLIDHGVTQFKCATTLELLMACAAGAADVLVAYSMVGPHARRVLEISRAHAGTLVSVLVENQLQAEKWTGETIGVFIDVNPGMDRTGIAPERAVEIATIAKALGDQFRGLHFYDGHVSAADLTERKRAAHAGYDQLIKLVNALHRDGIVIGEVITSGTPAFPYAMTYPGFGADQSGFLHRASPGTVVFNDMTSLALLPEAWGYRAAALVLATAISHPAEHRVTCDAGHKSVSADAGVPTCRVIGHAELQPLKPSEEHLPIDVTVGARLPAIGELLYLLPRHVCPTVNNFDQALLVKDGRVIDLESITARGHEPALVRSEYTCAASSPLSE